MGDRFSNEEAFQLLEAEWRAIKAHEETSRSDDIVRWESALEALKLERATLVERGEWFGGPADLLSIIGRSRRETYHSAVLGWLLDPQAPHGLGTACVDALLVRLGFPSADGRPVRVELEVVRGDTRADIVVSAPDVTLVIENKVDAGEMPRQCDRLYEHFGADPGVTFLFLTPSGRRPHTATGDAASAFRALSYRELGTLIRAALDRVPALPALAVGRQSVSNYIATLRGEFP